MFGKLLVAGVVAVGTGMIGSADPSSLLQTTKTADAQFYGHGFRGGYGYGFAPRSFYYGGFGPRYGIGPRIYPGFYGARAFRPAFAHPGFGYGFRRGVGFRRGFGGGGVFVGGRRGFVGVRF